MKPREISEQAQRIMENLLNTAELAEEAPDFVANSFQQILDEYADARLEEAAAMLDPAAAERVRGLKSANTPKALLDTLERRFADRRRT